MDLSLNIQLASNYKSKAQIARVLTEDWVLKNTYCPCCGQTYLKDFENNRPVADFYCKQCSEEFELKSKKGNMGRQIVGGSYNSMIERINANNNPNFFFMTYTQDWNVRDFLVIPKHFFTEDIIIQRKPLASTAKRVGWVGCNINIDKIPKVGKIFLLENRRIVSPKMVQLSFQKTLFLREKSVKNKGWLLDILYYIGCLDKEFFTLDEVYKFENELKIKYPDNHFIKDKIRQQLQILRDKDVIEFVSRGKYRKINSYP
ncbi:MAG: DpnI domain-containing protein [Alphaproteobacteria bacterium]